MKPSKRGSWIGRRKLTRALVISGAAAMVLVVIASWWVGGRLLAAVNREVGQPPPDLGAEPVAFTSGSGALLKGWLIRGRPGVGGVVLMHGIRADRRSMIGRARFLAEHGYSLLLFDFQAHGESEGKHITLGHTEADDARAAVAYMRERLPGEPVAALGSSLGGAALLLAEAPVDALVLEAVYPTIGEALGNRLALRLGPVGRWAAPLLVAQLRPRLGIDAAELSPIDHMANLSCPVLVIAGSKDQRTTLAESRRLAAAGSDRVQLWVVEGAAHVDFHRYAGRAYEARLIAFLERVMVR